MALALIFFFLLAGLGMFFLGYQVGAYDERVRHPRPLMTHADLARMGVRADKALKRIDKHLKSRIPTGPE